MNGYSESSDQLCMCCGSDAATVAETIASGSDTYEVSCDTCGSFVEASTGSGALEDASWRTNFFGIGVVLIAYLSEEDANIRYMRIPGGLAGAQAYAQRFNTDHHNGVLLCVDFVEASKLTPVFQKDGSVMLSSKIAWARELLVRIMEESVLH